MSFPAKDLPTRCCTLKYTITHLDIISIPYNSITCIVHRHFAYIRHGMRRGPQVLWTSMSG